MPHPPSSPVITPKEERASLRPLHITVLPGDGIGPDVMREALRVLAALNLPISYTTHQVGAAEYLRHGDPLPAAAITACREADAVLLGAMGLPNVRWPDGREMTPQIDLREQLDLYAGPRPIKLYHPLDSPLTWPPRNTSPPPENGDIPAAARNTSVPARKGDIPVAPERRHPVAHQNTPPTPPTIDLVIVRENTEGLFSARLQPQPHPEEATDILKLTRHGCERVIRYAFDLARKRRRHCTLVDKANVLPSMVFMRRVFDEIAEQYPDVHTDRVYIDAMALHLLRKPQAYDVIVTENMFGDILSDLAAGLIGGMGMAPSADIGDRCAIFQPCHGTAPDIAGKDIANPTAMILSAAMMLDWLGQTEAAQRIEAAVQHVFADPQNRTPDMGGTLRTHELTDLILTAIAPQHPSPEGRHLVAH